MRRYWVALALVVLAWGSADCSRDGGGRCEAPLVVVDEPLGEEVESLPVIAKLEDVSPPARDENVFSCGAEYGGRIDYRAKLGPLTARYSALDYKGQSIASNTTLSLASPTCPGTVVEFTMAGPSYVRLRRDAARDVYVVTGGILGKKAIAVRTASAAK